MTRNTEPHFNFGMVCRGLIRAMLGAFQEPTNMNIKYLPAIAVCALAVFMCFVLTAGSSSASTKQIVGVWFVQFPDAPFKYHMVTFHSDGTMEQANPDAGDAHASDSDGMGV